MEIVGWIMLAIVAISFVGAGVATIVEFVIRERKNGKKDRDN